MTATSRKPLSIWIRFARGSPSDHFVVARLRHIVRSSLAIRHVGAALPECRCWLQWIDGTSSGFLRKFLRNYPDDRESAAKMTFQSPNFTNKWNLRRLFPGITGGALIRNHQSEIKPVKES